MSDPRRLIDEGADAFEAKLLRAGQRDAPTARNRRRVVAGLGLAGVLSTSLVAAGAKVTTEGWLSAGALGALRWVGGGALGAAAVWAGVHTLALGSAPAPAQAPSALPAQVAASAPVGVATPSAAPAPAAATSLDGALKAGAPKLALPQRAPAAQAAADAAPSSLSAELAALDQARRALVSRDASSALRLLDDYKRRFPKRRLDNEASVLRIEALTARGDHANAVRLGKSFLARHPNGPYARRVSSLIAEPSPSAKAEP